MLPDKVMVCSSLVRDLIASVIGTVIGYNPALKLPGDAVVTTMIGVTISGKIGLGIVWKDVRQPFNL